jgi:hypothetical protein
MVMGVKYVFHRLRRKLLYFLHGQSRTGREIGIDNDNVVLHFDDDVIAKAGPMGIPEHEPHTRRDLHGLVELGIN